MVESGSDKSSACSRLLSDQERLIRTPTKDALNLEDTFSPNKGSKYSWDNNRLQGQRILAKLDRFISTRTLPIATQCRSLTTQSNMIALYSITFWYNFA